MYEISRPTDDRAEVIALIPALRAFARTFERDPEHADDLVQETLVKALKAFDSFMPGTRLKSWLFTIMRNTFYTSIRRRMRESPGKEDCVSLLGSTAADQEWRCRSNEVRDAIAKLPPQQAEVVALVAILGVSYDEAAEICGCNIGTIKSRLNRARTTLTHELLETSTTSASSIDTHQRLA